MLKKAVDNHRPPPTSRGKLSQQLFPSSSPTAPQSTVHSNANSQGRRSGVLQPLTRTAANVSLQSHPKTGGYGSRKPTELLREQKRDASGLARALNTPNSFDDVPVPAYSTKPNPVVIASPSPAEANTPVVYFDENDFESDIDLDVEDPATIGSASYPVVASTSVTIKPSTTLYPSLPDTDVHNHDSGISNPHSPKLPPSTIPLDWSSSPVEHLRQPPRPHAPLSSAQGLAPTQPAKRRTLPWRKESQEEIVSAQQRYPTPTSLSRTPSIAEDEHPSKRRKSAHDTGKNMSGYFATPATKLNDRKSFPWNTTASAIKTQQKTLRDLNAKTKASLKDYQAEVEKKVVKKSAKPEIFQLTTEQMHIKELILEGKKSVFFTGSAGTGKSVLLREIIRSLRHRYQKESDRVAVTASTGLAAFNIRGQTLHSFAGIGLGKEEVPELVKKIKRNQKAKHRWMRTKVLIIDEISMVDGDLFDKLEGVARAIRNNGRPFGGIQLVVTGDFFQLPPVPEQNKRQRFAFEAQTWETSLEHTIGLHQVFRQKDPVFANMLNEMREGQISEQTTRTFRSLGRNLDADDGLEATELFPTRLEVDQANNRHMAGLTGHIQVYEARDGGLITEKPARDKLLQNIMAPERIELKKGAQVMLIKNIDDTLVNGSQGIVQEFMSEATFDYYTNHGEHNLDDADDLDGELALQRAKDKTAKFKAELLASTAQLYPVVRFNMNDGTTRDLLVTRESWKVEAPNGEVQASRSQIPLILAWALSIHKAQGQTLQKVKVDLGKVFEKGQAYVALSRATSMAGLQVLRFDPKKVLAHSKVRDFYAGLSRAERAEGTAGGP